MVLQSYTAVVERAQPLVGEFATEPYEAGWAREALIFIRIREDTDGAPTVRARVQISPDGLHWVDEGTEFPVIEQPGLHCVRVREFGNWLRIAGRVDPPGTEAKALVYIALKE